jgi:hypothetical protein
MPASKARQEKRKRKIPYVAPEYRTNLSEGIYPVPPDKITDKVFLIEKAQKPILTSLHAIAPYCIIENIETKERPIVEWINLETGEAVIWEASEGQVKNNIPFIFTGSKSKTVNFDLSKYHIIFTK